MMNRIKIDEKSLFFGLYNNYTRGQTATVSTPINQSANPNRWHLDIVEIYNKGISSEKIPEHLKDKCTRKTTSSANTKVVELFEFDDLYFNGTNLNTDSSFAMYIKEEIDKEITNRDGKKTKNTHFGRKKLHYPITLNYKTDGFNIDNKAVLNAILNQNGGFAYVVNGFEVDIEKRKLNFLISMIGLKGVLLSSAFMIKKGVGKKLLLDELDFEAQDIVNDVIIEIPREIQDTVEFNQLNKIKVENGKLGEEYIVKNFKKYFGEDVEEIYHTSKYYPTSPYDIEYTKNGTKRYVEVKATSGTKKVFNLSNGEIKFMNKYKDNYTLVLVTEVKNDFPKVFSYDCKKIKGLRTEYPSIRCYDD